MSSYGNFAILYDTLMDDFDYAAWSEYIESIFKINRIQTGRILEMACGTGSLTEELLKRGFQVDGFDLSEEMLAQANSKLSGRRGFRLFRMDMTEFRMDMKYQAVVAACDSINYILSEESLLGTFKRVNEHLEDDGLFIFDINSEYKLMEILGDNIFIEDRDNIFYTWDNSFDQTSRICEFYLTFFYSEDGNNYSRFDEVHRERAYSLQDIIDLLYKAGFNDVEYYEAFGFDKVSEKTERINFVARKNKR
ncbi:MAG: class I SAM-dependent DNA methyltransferase [Bacillota bacterium]